MWGKYRGQMINDMFGVYGFMGLFRVMGKRKQWEFSRLRYVIVIEQIIFEGINDWIKFILDYLKE